MKKNKKIIFIIFGIFLSFLFNVFYYKIINKDSVLIILSKSVTINYLSFEPIFQRGRFIKNFDKNCEKMECLPFVKKKSYNRIIFIEEIKKILDKDKNAIIFVSFFLVDNALSDLRFYVKNPIYVDTKVLGISYYAEDKFFEKYKARFSLAYNYHFCNKSLEYHIDKSRIKQLKDLSKILKIETFCDEDFLKEFKIDRIKYIIDEKKYLPKKKLIYCIDNICLATI